MIMQNKESYDKKNFSLYYFMTMDGKEAKKSWCRH